VPNVFWLGCIYVTSIAETKLYAEQNFTCMNINGQKRYVRTILLPEFLHTIFKCCFHSVLYLLITHLQFDLIITGQQFHPNQNFEAT